MLICRSIFMCLLTFICTWHLFFCPFCYYFLRYLFPVFFFRVYSFSKFKNCLINKHAFHMFLRLFEHISDAEPNDPDSEQRDDTAEHNNQDPNDHEESSHDADSNPSFDEIPEDNPENELEPWVD